MTSTGESNSSTIEGVYGSNTLDRSDPFPGEDHETTKFIGGGSVNKFDFQTIKAANVANSIRSNRFELSKNELLHMLCYLEGELQARDVVIAALRNERVKQYIHALRSKRISLNDPQAALFRDKAAFSGNNVSRQSSAAAIQADLEVRGVIEQQIESLNQVIMRQRLTQTRMVTFLSDSLENNQRMRQELEEEKRKHEHDTAQGDDITYGLEMERTKLKQELETERTNRKKLEKDVKKAQDLLEFERGRQKQIVLLLLAERKKIIMKYIEERKRSEDLAQILSEEKQRSDTIAEGLEEESKKSLRMEADLEKQTVMIENERKAWKVSFAKEEKRVKEIELELAQLRNENEAFRKQIALRMSGVSPVIVGATAAAKVRGGGNNSGNAMPSVLTDDATAGAVVSSSIMNVAKIIQPTATVSSVPVSGPTTGIARSISPGQCLRQQATVGCSELILGGPAPIASHQTTASGTFNASIGKISVSSIQAMPPSENMASVPTNVKIPAAVGATGLISSANISSSLSAVSGAMGIGGTLINQPQTATIHRAGINSSASAHASALALVGSASSGGNHIGGGIGRGVPPPIPPNKPTVPPKREQSISRISTAGNSVSNNTIPLGAVTSAILPSSVSLPSAASVTLTNNTSVVPSTISNSTP